MGTPGSITTVSNAIILFDGVCNLCNGAVQFIIKRDPDSYFRFASLQSEFGRTQLKAAGLETTSLFSIIVIENGKAFQRSDAVLRIVSHLRGWKFMRVFRFVPRPLRDGIYNIIAANRYRIFGKEESCMIPTPELKARFLE